MPRRRLTGTFSFFAARIFDRRRGRRRQKWTRAPVERTSWQHRREREWFP